MAAILTSLWKLAENMGISIKKDTIEEQINAMNKALEVNQENNIANALWNYADASGGGGSIEFSKIKVVVPCNPWSASIINNDFSEVVATESDYGTCTFLNPIKKYVKGNQNEFAVVFTPTEDYQGFYLSNGTTKISFSGDSVVAGDGCAYLAKAVYNGPGSGTTYTMECLSSSANFIEIIP